MSALNQFEHLRIPLEDIRSATNDFSEVNCIGAGGFGKLYKGVLFLSGEPITVAANHLDRTSGQGDAEFWMEVTMLSSYKHKNIVSLLGFCDEKGEKILVYEYASNNSLDLHLDSKDLTWVRRLRICIGAARGLEYLHYSVGAQHRVLHRDIKSSNILLDEDWNGKIAGLGLSIISPANIPNTFLITNSIGTYGYTDPEYMKTGVLTKESDVYSFGVVLFEVLCGRLCYQINDKPRQSLTKLVKQYYKQNKLNEIIWIGIKDEINPASLKAFATIAYQCLKSKREERPLMADVLTNLENALTYQIYAEGTKISLRDIQLATNYFASNKCIGEGGFGKVYMGELLHSGGHIMTVAVKRLNPTNEHGNRGFKNERNLSQYRNGNIVNLLGYCDDDNEKILVYEYAAKRSLDFYLNNYDLRWVRRLKICIGAASGLVYLHNPDGYQESVWHLDIKSGNILLDENWNAKITDFGLSKFIVANQEKKTVISGAVGTPGYCDPVYIETGSPTKESDIYSFGVVLFEMLCGRLNTPNKYEHRSLAELTRNCYEKSDLSGIIFGNIKDEISPSSLRSFVTIAYRCLRRDREERPSMKEILTTLEIALECQVAPLNLTPPPTPSSKSNNEYQRSLKPLLWETTRATVGSLWDVSHKHGSRVPEMDISELDMLFSKYKDSAQPGYKTPKLENLFWVHPDRASSCRIMLQDIKLPIADIINAILALDSSDVNVDQVYDLNEFCPTNEEMEMLSNYAGDKEILGECEQFFLECAKIPRMNSKLQVFAFAITFSRRVNNFRDTLNIIKDVNKEIKESTKLAKIMQIILMLGNKLNAGIAQGSAEGFKLGSLERLGYTWARDKNITLLHFLCKVIAEQTPELLYFYNDMTHLQDAYWIQIKDLYDEKSAIINSFQKVKQEFSSSVSDGSVSAKFRKALRPFLDSADAKLPSLISLFDEVYLDIESLVIYFGEDPDYYSWRQVITSLVNFIELFKKAHNHNKMKVDARKMKLETNGDEE
ncbi:unnamed protein product [Lactuca saligna]|uniref:Formin-like protein n=1 Tax=Lactuca saligna TaxID=75948 RepID=A0AA36E7A0_LACSI|nr:unnamed protein product [Lactuca saligna]